MLDLCLEIAKPIPKQKLRPWFPAAGFSDGMRQFARVFSDMHEQRALADYDPRAGATTNLFSKSSVQRSVDSARTALRQFWATPEEERKLFATLIAHPPR